MKTLKVLFLIACAVLCAILYFDFIGGQLTTEVVVNNQELSDGSAFALLVILCTVGSIALLLLLLTLFGSLIFIITCIVMGFALMLLGAFWPVVVLALVFIIISRTRDSSPDDSLPSKKSC